MNPDQPKIRELFVSAIQMHPDCWATFLDQECEGRPNLRREVWELLHAHRQDSNFLRLPDSEAAVDPVLGPGDTPTATTADENPASIIGPYKLGEQIGEGGFGVVFIAEQKEPIRRKVALKVVKPGMDTREVIARFEIERQTLAEMDHPNIAKVLDAGQTSSGRPYFVMELVKGVAITMFCDESQLTFRERLELFLSVCKAVQHAHQKAIIHCDIKPSNVLVTMQDGLPLVKVIDFGIARALGPQLTDKSAGVAQMIGTPLYMSPEQAAICNVDVDTRSDIYSLGVLLYELLTGTTPVDKMCLQQAAPEEIRRIIREEEPPKPSTRVSTLGQDASTVSAQRKSDPKSLSRLFRRDLDWIVMKALDKDRNRRYQTANGFAEDIQRYLADEVVLAGPPSSAYHLRKFVQRNSWALVVASAATVLLMALITVGFLYLQQATKNKHQAEIAKLVNRLEDIWNSPFKDVNHDVVAADLLTLAAIDPVAAGNQRVKYVDKLLGMSDVDVHRLKKAVEPFAGGENTGLQSPVRTAYFRQRVAPEDRFDKIDFYARPNPSRVEDLKLVVEVEDVFGRTPGRPGARLTLLHAYMVDKEGGNLDRAWELAAELLDRHELLPAWRLLIIRDMVWLAIGSSDKSRLVEATHRLNDPKLHDPSGHLLPSYYEISVEKARLLNAAGDVERAAQMLDEYLSDDHRRKLDLRPESTQTLNNRFDSGPTRMNVPVLFYLDAALLRGFLAKQDPKKIWKHSFEVVRSYRTGSYYEAAVLGSLANELGASDAIRMAVDTAEDAVVKSPVMQNFREIPTNPKALETVTEILRNAWQTDRGRKLAKEIATRELPFADFVHVQFRLWVYEGLRILTCGPRGQLGDGEDEVYWGIAEDLRTDLSKGLLTESGLTELFTFAAGDIKSTNVFARLPDGIRNPAKWQQVAEAVNLSSRLRGPIAYVLGRAYSQQVPIFLRPFVDLKATQNYYFDYAREHAGKTSHPEALRKALSVTRSNGQ